MKNTKSTQQMEEPGPGTAIAESNDPGRVAHPTMSKGLAGWPKLPDSLERFMRLRRIDSYHKIWFLLLMHQHSEQRFVSREYVRQVSFADAPTLDEVIAELQHAGLLTGAGDLLSLDDAPELLRELDAMALVFADPIGRQELLRFPFRTPSAAV